MIRPQKCYPPIEFRYPLIFFKLSSDALVVVCKIRYLVTAKSAADYFQVYLGGYGGAVLGVLDLAVYDDVYGE